MEASKAAPGSWLDAQGIQTLQTLLPVWALFLAGVLVGQVSKMLA